MSGLVTSYLNACKTVLQAAITAGAIPSADITIARKFWTDEGVALQGYILVPSKMREAAGTVNSEDIGVVVNFISNTGRPHSLLEDPGSDGDIMLEAMRWFQQKRLGVAASDGTTEIITSSQMGTYQEEARGGIYKTSSLVITNWRRCARKP